MDRQEGQERYTTEIRADRCRCWVRVPEGRSAWRRRKTTAPRRRPHRKESGGVAKGAAWRISRTIFPFDVREFQRDRHLYRMFSVTENISAADARRLARIRCFRKFRSRLVMHWRKFRSTTSTRCRKAAFFSPPQRWCECR